MEEPWLDITETLCKWQNHSSGLNKWPGHRELQCWLDISTVVKNLLGTFAWFSILIRMCVAVKREQKIVCLPNFESSVVYRYSLHNIRWLLTLALFFTHLVDLGEVLLVWKHNPAQTTPLSLLVPICNGLVVVFSCFLFDQLEVWKRDTLLLWTCPYWLTEAIINLIRWHHFRSSYTRDSTAQGSFLTVTLGTTWTKLFLAILLLIVDAFSALQVNRKKDCSDDDASCERERGNKMGAVSMRSLDSVFVQSVQQDKKLEDNRTFCYLHGQANLLSKATFFWLNPLLVAGFCTPLEQKHLGPLPNEYKSSHLVQHIRCLIHTDTPNLWRCYWKFSWQAIILGGWLKFAGDLVGYVAPLGIQIMVNFVNTSINSSTYCDYNATEAYYSPSVIEFISNGYIMAVIVFLSSFLQGTLSQASSHVLCVEGIRLKTALQSFMYEKCLRLSSLSGVIGTSESEKTEDEDHTKAEDLPLQLDAGTFSQLLTEDCDNIMVLLCLCHYLWAIPLKLAILLYLLHQKLGIGSVIAALLCLLLMVPAQFLLGKNISQRNKQSMKEAGKRLAKIHEWLSNMKMFRLYAWEHSELSRIRDVRRKELNYLWSYSIQWAWATFLTQASTVALTLLTFVLYPFLSSSGTSPYAAQALSGLALINQFTVPLTIIPVIVPELIAACNSTIRLQDFFRKPDVNNQRNRHSTHPHNQSTASNQLSLTPNDPSTVRTLENITEDEEPQLSGSESCTESDKSTNYDYGESILKASRATFSWHATECQNGQNVFKLSNINLNIPRGKLTAIVGHVGSGKSSLLMALLGELDIKTGSLTWSASVIKEQIGYVAQRPWLMHASLRDNILFGNPLSAKRYSKVLEACALNQDIELLPHRDATLIGSKGQNVSGGQKARISLARAIYSPASTLLLDDPFAALDIPVAQHIFHEAIQKVLLRHGRNVIMATHHMEYALQADHVIVLESGSILIQGPPDQVTSAWPELLDRSSQTAQDQSSFSKAKDRWNMLRLVTKTGYVFKVGSNRKEDEIANQSNHHSDHSQRWKRRSSRFNALSIHMSHDLPLLTDEMAIDEILPDGGLICARQYGSKSLRTRRHVSSLNGPSPETLSDAHPQSRSTSFSLKGSRTAVASFLNRRRAKSKDRFSQIHHRPVVSLLPLADSSWCPNGADSNTQLSASVNKKKPSLFRLYSTPVAKRQHSEVESIERRTSTDSDLSLLHLRKMPQQEQPQQQHSVQRLLSTVSGFSDEIAMDSDSDQERGLLRDPPAAPDEERQYGRIPRRLYWLYARACGLILTFCYFCGSIGWQSARLATDYWLVVYQIENQDSLQANTSFDHQLQIMNVNAHSEIVIADGDQEKENDTFYYLSVYIILSVVSVVAALLTNLLGQAAGNQGRKRLHDNLLSSLSRCHARLFDVEPTGRLLNRFSTDMSMIDKKLATTVQRLVQFVLMCLSAIVVNVIISPWSLLIALLIVAIFYMLQRFFRTSARELQRLESLARGPVVSHLTETLSGLSTVRAFCQEKRFQQTMHDQMDAHSAAVLVLNSTNRWLGFALDTLGAAVVLVAMLLAMWVHHCYPGYLTPGQVGLAISYTLMTPIYLQWVVRFWSELEMYFNAVERVLHYSRLPTENGETKAKMTVDIEQWPRKGDMEISNLSVTYHQKQEPILRDFNLKIIHGQKVGICGRTGSGKSTLVNAIFRLADIVSGSITLNGVDIMSLEAHYVRSKLAAVPQDTLIITGTLRHNLDPENKIADEKLWAVLEAVHLKDTFRDSGLDTELYKSGSCSLSIGQQQLLSLARAALRASPVLILDEPSSALDAEAEQTLHNCLDNLFHDRTVLLIAHRVSSLRKCDTVCVLENGQLVLQGPPDEILSELQIDE